jgi:hypothetical protein
LNLYITFFASNGLALKAKKLISKSQNIFYKTRLFQGNLLYMTENNTPLDFNVIKFGSNGSIRISHHKKLDAYTIFVQLKPRDLVKKHIVLEPGLYYIDYIDLVQTGGLIRWFPSPGIRKDFITYGMFEVKAGEVLSLGHLDVTGVNFKHYNTNMNELKSQLIDSDLDISELSSKLKLGTFYNRGSFLVTDKNNKVSKVYSPEIIENERKKMMQEIIRRLKPQV